MESKNRGVWILVALAAIALCCCVVLLAAIAVIRVWDWNWSWGLGVPEASQEGSDFGGARIDRSFDVGQNPVLTVDNFAGSLDVRSGDGNEIRIVAVKHAPRRSDLDRIEVAIRPEEGVLRIVTSKPRTLRNAWVEVTVTAPAGTRLDLSTGSGSIEVRGFEGGALVHTGSGSIAAQSLSGGVNLHTGSGSIKIQDVAGQLKADTGSGGIGVQGMVGDLEAHTGSGNIDVRGAAGIARLSTSSGRVEYQGAPHGGCLFTTGSGGISLRLPSGLDAEVDLQTRSGRVQVDYPVEGQVTRTDVRGVIGRGGTTTIRADTGSGNIDLVSE
jgi:DUF4097 and DUF4098 domain-containing protein YvlB